ncbi:heterokaryon incompatibility protein-domain-containing protein [Echria macrotheca]|uniref:Heterokaryon incompatibility protein-domain-containing protein n=1 Tax=Echria macrotheca TaxID=438768 RepID=A0AAJ0B5U1_9PEZI|nr:heterokaryon incompatibility protein-domain-containing protein [Echria macrotheca]
MRRERRSARLRKIPEHAESLGSNVNTAAGRENVYTYDELKKPTSIRLLELLPGSPQDQLECQLYDYDLGLLGGSPFGSPYEAISYVWGSAEKTKSIICNGAQLAITANLENVLRRVRLPDSTRKLWADAICINQDDVSERNQQVGLMDKVYSLARNVLFCLDADTSRDSAQLPPEIFDSITPFEWEKTVRLLGCEWWSRVWVLQEFGLAYNGHFLYGREMIDRLSMTLFVTSMAMLSSHLPVYHRYREEGDILTRAHNLMFLYKYQTLADLHGKVDYLDVLQATRTSRATLSHDYVYSTFGHPAARAGYRDADGMQQYHLGKQDNSPLLTQPDYRKSTATLFKEVAVHILRQTGNLRLLSAVSHDERTISLTEGYPSWVPRWDVPKGCIALGDGLGVSNDEGRLAYDASSGSSQLQQIQIDGDSLIVRGFVFDEIAGCIMTFPSEILGADLETLDEEIFGRIQAAVGHIKDVGDKPKRRRQGPPAALQRTLTAGLSNWTVAKNHIMRHGPIMNSEEETMEANFAAFFSRTARRRTRSSKTAKGDGVQFLLDVQVAAADRVLFVTRRGFLGLGPRILEEGDICCVIFGAMVPLVLRPKPNGQYVLVGESYIHGIMRGEGMEAFREGKFDATEFSIG